MHWTYRRDGFTFSNHRFKYGAFNHLEDQVSVPVDCDAITEEGSISANTSHHGLWTIPVSGINEIINMTMDREDETSDSETCPPPQTDTYDVEERNPNGGSGSGGEGEPTEDSGWCLVRVTYVVATGRIIDVDILFCW